VANARKNLLPTDLLQQRKPGEHPLMPSIRMAREGLRRIDANISDYTCKLVKRERINGEVLPREFMAVKIRHEPFSVYMYFLGPKNIRGRECIYVEGQNDNKLIAHEGGGKISRSLPTVEIDPNGFLAMRNQRYPITEVGVRNLIYRLIERAEPDTKYGECDVQIYRNAKVNGRVCTGLEVTHPVRRKNFLYHKARIFIDDELQLPIHYSSYDWPSTPGGPAELIEEYTYLDIKVNPGLTDKDFDRNNPDYAF